RLYQERPNLETIRAVERVLRAREEEGLVVAPRDDLLRDLWDELDADVGETRLSVAVSALEQIGLLRRGLDVPRAVTLRVSRRAQGDHAFRAFVASARLRPGEELVLDAAELASRTG